MNRVIQRASTYKELNLSVAYVLKTFRLDGDDISFVSDYGDDIAMDMTYKFSFKSGGYKIIYILGGGFVKVSINEGGEEVSRFNEQYKLFNQIDVVSKVTGLLLSYLNKNGNGDSKKSGPTTKKRQPKTKWGDVNSGSGKKNGEPK